MKVYLVGGAVRDTLLQRPVKDRDFVVTGATPQQMLDLGFDQVGADFPVFLHPHTREEYALARTERKTGSGYNGFTTQFDPSITLEDDLRRRDLTINAMAKDLETGEIIDPFNGMFDLENQTLRHVSPAFAEDPLRVLRVARFRARFGFRVAFETTELMCQLVNSGELDHLTPERVWLELEKGLSEKNPFLFVETLLGTGAWKRLFPQVVLRDGVMELDKTIDKTFAVKVMVMLSNTPLSAAINFLEKFKAPTEIVRDVTVLNQLQDACKTNFIDMFKPLSAESTLSTLKRVDAFRRPESLQNVTLATQHMNLKFAVFVNQLTKALQVANQVTFASLDASNLSGPEIGKAMDAARLKKLNEVDTPKSSCLPEGAQCSFYPDCYCGDAAGYRGK